jgi:hypothetical protein
MLSLFDLGLTHMQMQEVAAADEVLVEAWLHAASAPKIKTPAGYFLTGLRSGDMPLSQNIDARRAAVRLAELWIVNAGLYMPTGEEVLHELFERNGSRLHPWYDDEDLRAQMLDVWENERPRAARAAREQQERAERHAEATKAQQSDETA